MSLQLVTPGEPLATKDPVTDEWPLASVPAQVGPQVGRLSVHLPTALHMADVLLLLCGVTAVPATHTLELDVMSFRLSTKNALTDYSEYILTGL